MAEAIQRWKTEYLPARRKYIYNTQIVGKGGEIPLAADWRACHEVYALPWLSGSACPGARPHQRQPRA